MALPSKKHQSFSTKEDTTESLLKYLKYWYVFAIAIVLCLSAAYAYITYATPFYKVSSTLLIQNDFKGDGLLKGTAFSDLDMFHAARTVDNEMEVLRSRDLIYKTLKDLSLETRYHQVGKINDKELYDQSLPIKVVIYNLNNKAYAQKLNLIIKNEDTFSITNNGKRVTYRFDQLITGPGYSIKVIKGPAFKTNFEPIDIAFKDLYSMAEYYSLTSLTILPIVKDANTIVISLLDNVPQRGVDILNKLIENYNGRNVDTKNIVARNTIRFIDDRLRSLSSDLSVVEQDVEDYKQRNRVTNFNADAEINLKTSGNYDQELSQSQIQLDVIQSLEEYLNQEDSKYEIVPSTLGIGDVTLTNLINRYNDMQIDRQRLLRSNKSSNPLIVNIDDQLVALKSNLKENLRNVRRGLSLARNNYLSKSNQYESRIRNVPTIERGLMERNRTQAVQAGLYEYLLQKREETALSLSATIPTSQVVDKPAYNTNPAKPKEALIYLCSLFAGFLLPLFIFFGKDKLNTKVQDVNDVQLIGGTRILGELSHKEENNTVVIKKGSRTTISELFRYIRSNLGLMNNHLPSQVLLVTSGSKGEGKTFFSINLGVTLSMVDKKVIIIEFDLRKPDLIKGINMKYEKGLTDYLDDDNMDLSEVIKPSGVSPNMFVIGCGKLPDDPSDLLHSRKIKSMFDELRKKFDYIIVDTSPVGLVSDAFSLAQYTDASIYLIRYNFTRKMQLGVLEDICENKKLKNLMIVFNDAKKENMKSYGYGGYAYEAS
ncbi:GumC family protein [Pedobacter cryophilus]|uniref:non-specific protein-tyrosine kinase n=1 Tax=Pedobacter cryophilus TaxID=2571271 RepID=A0A4U1BXA7_9SPHI|nr:tyrosine-protein kinase [Pedobacter cryophilus]TKB97636.1 polysaccharide biosynthesis tyrosine autokinase [Pedobacter cryophilus]